VRTTAAFAIGLLLLAQTANAADTADVSLAKEVERYLDQTTIAADGDKAEADLSGPTIKVKKGDHKVELNGRLMFDIFFIDADDGVFANGDAGDGAFDSTDGSFFRRVRLAFRGTVYKNTIFKVQIDFAKAEIALKDVYVGLQKLGFVSKIMVGHFKEPMGLEELTSSKYDTFIEQSGASAFSPSRNDGIMASGDAWEKKFTWAIGIFRTANDNGVSRSDGGYSMTLRITAIFLENEENSSLLHAGFSFSYRGDRSYRLRMRPGPGTGDRTISTGTIGGVDDISIFGFELAGRFKSFHAMFELYISDVSTAAGDPQFVGWYFEIGWWITGEVKAYKGNKWARTKPNRNFHNASGPGGWQVAYRFDNVDLVDAGIAGGEQVIHTFGVNWHWNPHTRVMFNVMFANVDENSTVDENVTSFITRFQFDF
jgi:phosphate-selective porin OprO/OprP